ncbi:hypothetical protein Tco_0367004 [Tanacetum coccineum]
MVGSLCNKFKRGKDKVMREKAMLAEAQESSQILDEVQLAFLTDLGILDGQTAQTTIPNNAAFQTEDLDAYDSDYDDVLNAKAVLMANLSSYGSDVILEVPHFEPYHNDMVDQSVPTIQDFEQTSIGDFSDNKITSDSNIILYFQYLQETQQAAVQDAHLYAQQDSMILSVIEKISREKMIDSQIDDMIKEKLALKQQIDSLEQNISNLIKEKESLLQTFIVFKNESKEKESKYIDKEIGLEKKIKELDNNVYKVGQSAQTVHIVISSQHVAMHVIDDDETLILEEILRNVVYLNKNCLLNKLSGFKCQTLSLNLPMHHMSKWKFPVNSLRTTPDALTEELFLENDRLLQTIMSQDVLLSVMNYITLNGESNVENQRSESCDKCFDLDLKSVDG